MVTARLAAFLGASLVACLAASLAFATRGDAQASRPWGGIGWIDANSADFRRGTTATRGIGSRGWGFDIGGGATYRRLIVGADVGLNSFHDDSSFSESTTGGTRSSSTSALYGSLFVGALSPALRTSPRGEGGVVAGVITGVSGWSADRSIASCVNCRSDALDVKAGGFVEPFVVVGVVRDRIAGIRIAWRRFIEGGATVNSVVSLGFVGGLVR
ncbi:MAG: hypothetical protein U9Q74_16735 [Gemmatimonadota bacterium]|nr:hypothetical protein [Gemmatimonadota bacterium]